MSYLLAYITASDLNEAEKIGQALVQNKLVACVNIFSGMQSMYMWKGGLEKSQETVIIAKTTEKLRDRVLEKVQNIHSYECPCIIFIPVMGGNPEFLQWITHETGS